MSNDPRWRPETQAVALGRPTGPGAPLNVPPNLASTYLVGTDLVYSRYGNPAYDALEEAVGALEGGHAVSFASGMSASAAVIESLPSGARVVAGTSLYNGTRQLLADLASRGRLVHDPVDPSDIPSLTKKLVDADLLWVESPTNPLIQVVDLEQVGQLAAAANVPLVVDNTFATPILQNPLKYGAAAVVHSATKFIGGHSDLILGVVVVPTEEAADELVRRRILHGGAAGGMETFLALRGLRTLPIRIQTAQRSAGIIATRLAEHRSVSAVFYPGLIDDPGHEIATKQMRGYGSMLSFTLPSEDAAEQMLGRTNLIRVATSLGAVETTAERRNRWPGEGAPTGLIRLSVGIEHVEDIWSDISDALDAV